MHRPLFLRLLAAATAAGILLRLWQVGESLWVDELHTSWCVSGGLADVWPRATVGNQSPVYFWWLWLLVQVAGQSEAALRMTSLVCSTAIIPLASLLVLRWTRSAPAALLAAVLAAVDGNFLFYALEARPYALAQLLGLAQVAVYLSLGSRPTTVKRAFFISLTVAMLYVHYTTAILLAGQLAHAAATARFTALRRDYGMKQLLLDLSLTGLLWLPTAWHWLDIFQRRENWKAFVRADPLHEALFLFPIGACLILPLLVTGLSRLPWAGRKARATPAAGVDRGAMLFVAAWYLAPLLVAWGLTWFDVAPVLLRRYLITIAAAPIVACAMLYVAAKGRAAKIVLAGAAVGTMLVWGGPPAQFIRDGRFVRHSEEDWRGAIGRVNEIIDERPQPVLVGSGLIEADRWAGGEEPLRREYCLLPVRGMYRLSPEPPLVVPLSRSAPGILTAKDALAVARFDSAVVILRGTDATAQRLQNDLRESLAPHGKTSEVVAGESFGRVQVLRIAVE